MTTGEQQVREMIAEQAREWFLSNDEKPLDAEQSAALVAWLKASPAHVEEFLAVGSLARALGAVGTDPQFSVDALMARVRAENQDQIPSVWSGAAAVRGSRLPRWRLAAAVVAVVAVAMLAVFLRNAGPARREPPTAAAAALHLATRHGQLETYRLADNSVLHLNTDSELTVRYSPKERLVVLLAGEADFEVVHDPLRAFRVVAGPAVAVDLGTRFDVRLDAHRTVLTVSEGRVAVSSSAMPPRSGAVPGPVPPPVQLLANQQTTVAEGRWPAIPVAVDSERATAWLHHQIVFDHEPLERVAAEFNRYTAKPIEITTPALRQLEVSGVFATDDPEEFLAFLRSLKGVRVEVTATTIRVSQK